LSVYPHIDASDFSVQVDYLPASLKEKKLKVNLTKVPGKVKILKISPSEVEYIIISK